MKIAKRLFSVMLVAVVAAGLLVAGCGNAQAAKTKKTNGSTVILYFSGTGNTRTIARRIQKSTKGKLIQIKASDPYTDADLNYSNEDSRVVKEHLSNGGDDKTPLDSSVRPEISNLSAIRKAVKSAKTVYIGYPIWWQQAPHIMYSLVENVSLNGKKVVPFNSSMASGSGSSSDNLLKDARVNSKTVWLSGKGFIGDDKDSLPSQGTINKWVKKVNRTKKGKKIPSKSSNNKSNNDAATANNENNNANVTPASENGKTLVVYFSGTGNTERVAKTVASAAGADTFVITPKDPYTNDDLNFNNENSRVVREYLNPDLQNVELSTTTVPGWDSYDTVFIGYPIWWGNEAWPVNGFVKANDFTGKTVIPFCTSLSSGIGQSGTNLANMAGGSGKWQEGHRFSENASDSEVNTWVESLGLQKKKITKKTNDRVTVGKMTDRGFIVDNVMHSESRGDIHFSSYVPDSYTGKEKYALFISLPGWEGEYPQGVGSNLQEFFPFEAQKYNKKMIIISPQLMGWDEDSADDTIALTEYLLDAYNIDRNKVYLEGYSGGGETGSIAVGKRPDLYTAWLMGSSQWDGDYDSVVNAELPVYLAVGESDSYYGSGPLKKAYNELHRRYVKKGLSESQIKKLLVLDVKPASYFTSQRFSDQHAGGQAFANDKTIMSWLFEK